MSGRCRQIMLCYGQTRSLRNALTCARAYATPKMCCRSLCCRLDESVEDMNEREQTRMNLVQQHTVYLYQQCRRRRLTSKAKIHHNPTAVQNSLHHGNMVHA